MDAVIVGLERYKPVELFQIWVDSLFHLEEVEPTDLYHDRLKQWGSKFTNKVNQQSEHCYVIILSTYTYNTLSDLFDGYMQS